MGYNIFDIANAFADLEPNETAVFTKELTLNQTTITLSVTGEGTLKSMGVFAQLYFGLAEKDEKAMFYSAPLQKNSFPEFPTPGQPGQYTIGHQFRPIPLMELVELLNVDPNQADWNQLE